MNNLLKILFGVFITSVLSLPAFGSGNVTVSTKLDSTILLMGKQTALHVEVNQDKDVIGGFTNEIADTLCKYVEIVGRSKSDTVELGNNRIQINRILVLQSFDSGLYVLPPLQYVVGNDTFKSAELSLKVIPVNVDSLSNIHDYKSVENVPFHIIDFLPDFIVDYWWVYVIFVILIAAALIVYYWLKKKPVKVALKIPKISPYDEAMQRLEELKNRKLWQSGQEKEYYTILTDILRNYIDRRFGINAMEMTSSQIIATLRKNKETKAVNEQLNQILEMADFVKFAKMRPLPDDNEASMQRALNFVDETQPAPAADENGEPANNTNDDANEHLNKEEGGQKQ